MLTCKGKKCYRSFLICYPSFLRMFSTKLLGKKLLIRNLEYLSLLLFGTPPLTFAMQLESQSTGTNLFHPAFNEFCIPNSLEHHAFEMDTDNKFTWEVCQCGLTNVTCLEVVRWALKDIKGNLLFVLIEMFAKLYETPFRRNSSFGCCSSMTIGHEFRMIVWLAKSILSKSQVITGEYSL